jgi:hypothetical protein
VGPGDGRYLTRGDDEDLNVVVFRTVAAPRRSFRERRRPKRAEAGSMDPEPVSMSRVTVIDSVGFDGEAAAKEWLARCEKDESTREQEVTAALEVVNRAVFAHRVAAGDPYIHELNRGDAHTVRLGYGAGEEVVEGQWRAACTLPEPRKRLRRRQMLAPQEQAAAILSGRSQSYPSEDLALRARLDLEHGRIVQAALQLRAAVDALESELAAGDDPGREALAGVRDVGLKTRKLADAALRGELDERRASALGELLDAIERPLRRRRHTTG